MQRSFRAARFGGGWYSRSRLPHFDGGEVAQFVTYRLEGALPSELVQDWRQEACGQRAVDPASFLRRRIEQYLDEGHGPRLLADPIAAGIVQEGLLYFDGQRYRMHAWVVMPTHVHALFTPSKGYSLATIIQAWKSVSSRRISAVRGERGTVWQREYFDRTIRDARHFWSVANYIDNNPVKAGLCERAVDFEFSSARRHAGGAASAPGFLLV